MLYSNIIKRSQNFAQDSKLREIIKALQYFTYGEDGESWALTELVGLSLKFSANYSYTSDYDCSYSVSRYIKTVSIDDTRPVRNPAKELSFARPVRGKL